MPVTWTISHPTRSVTAVAKGPVRLADVQAYLDAVVVGEAMSYRKLFEVGDDGFELSDADMMALAARIRAYAITAKMGPLAIVAPSPKAYDTARTYVTLATADRLMQIFKDANTARKWLEAQPLPA